tara:strand:- start:1780 stop:2670 length:891 start_codon:yes stop_codon:yes gene_type:complete
MSINLNGNNNSTYSGSITAAGALTVSPTGTVSSSQSGAYFYPGQGALMTCDTASQSFDIYTKGGSSPAISLQAGGTAKFAGKVYANESVYVEANNDRSHLWFRDSSAGSYACYVDFGANPKYATLFDNQSGAEELENVNIRGKNVFSINGRLVQSGDSSITNLKDANGGDPASAYLETTGTYGAKGIFYDINSDIRLKKNIQPTTVDATNIIDNLDFISYNWKDQKRGADRVELGVSAQQLQRLAPRTVSEFSDGYLFLNSNEITMYLLKALQESNSRIQALEEKLNTLQKQEVNT